jgi:uncharacterized protein (TIGR02145 family)
MKSHLFLTVILIGLVMACDDDEVSVVIESDEVTSITATTAVSGGAITAGYSAVKSKGICWSVNPNPTVDENITVDNSTGNSFSNQLTGLSPSTLYYVRAYALTENSIVYGNAQSFTTTVYEPVISFELNINHIGAEYFRANYSMAHYEPEMMQERGLCWSTNPLPTVNDKTGEYGNSLNDKLTPATTYYIRAYARHSAGVVYSNQVSFKTLTPLFPKGNGVTDIDGNTYNSILVNGKEWMVPELKVKHYANGDPIPNVVDNIEWSDLTTGAWSTYSPSCQFNHYGVDLNTKIYYNWYAVNDDRNVCPTGWRVATATEWDELLLQVGSDGYRKLVLDAPPFNVGTNQSGFQAVPSGGYRRQGGFFYCTDIWNQPTLYWWTASEFNADQAINGGFLFPWSTYFQFERHKNAGLLVRCVKD